MSNYFSNFKLKRANIFALFEKEDINGAIIEYKKYKKQLNSWFFKVFFRKEYLEEKQTLQKKLIEKLQNFAENFSKDNKYDDALVCYQTMYEEDSENIDNLRNYISNLDKLKQYDLELYLSKKLLKMEDIAKNYKSISKVFENCSQYDEAIDFYKKFVELEGRKEFDVADCNTIGCLYFNAYINKGQKPADIKLALDYFLKTVEANDNNKIYLKNTILAAMKAKNWELEKKYWEKYIENGFLTKDDEFTLSASYLRNGEIENWGKYYGSRFEKNNKTQYPEIKKPEWKGQDLKNKTLLIHYEQGFGDNFLMFGYIGRFSKMAKNVIYVVQTKIADLLKNSNEFDNVEILAQNEADLSKLKFDYHLPSMSIPIALKLNKDNISVVGGYIKAQEEKVKEYKEKYFNNNKFKIGFSFMGVAANAKRNIPFETLLKLDKLKGVELYCLNKDVSDNKLKAFKKNKVKNIAKSFCNFDDTAAAIENLDLVISSDNCILNLAGAMGKRTFAMFHYHYEFRWYDLTGNDTGWFKSAKPFVNDENNDWDLNMDRVIEEINRIKN